MKAKAARLHLVKGVGPLFLQLSWENGFDVNWTVSTKVTFGCCSFKSMLQLGKQQYIFPHIVEHSKCVLHGFLCFRQHLYVFGFGKRTAKSFLFLAGSA